MLERMIEGIYRDIDYESWFIERKKECYIECKTGRLNEWHEWEVRLSMSDRLKDLLRVTYWVNLGYSFYSTLREHICLILCLLKW